MKTTWISIYIDNNRSPYDLLRNVINPLLTSQKETVYKFFFVFYGKTFPHLRLRLLVDTNKKEIIIKQITDKLERVCKTKLQPYRRESKRYGGRYAINLAEDNFYLSSETVLSFLKMKKNLKYTDAISFSILLQSILLNSLGYSRDNSLLFYKFLNSHKMSNREYDLHNDINKRIVFSTYSLLKVIQNDKFPPYLEKWSQENKKIFYKLKKLKEKNMLTQPTCPFTNLLHIYKENFIIWHIYDSYIHMTNNRLGIHSKDEKVIYYIMYEALKMYT